VATLKVSGAGSGELPDPCACCSFAQWGNVVNSLDFGVPHFGDIAVLFPLDLGFGLHGHSWGCFRSVDWFGRKRCCLDRDFVDGGRFGTSLAGRHFALRLGSFCASCTGLRYGLLLRMLQCRLRLCWARDSLWSWHLSRSSGYCFVCDDFRRHLHYNRQAFWQFGFIRAMVLPNWKLLSHEENYALVLFLEYLLF